MSNVTLDVPDISCGHCKMSIEEAVGKLAYVKEVVVDIDSRTVDVVYDGSDSEFESIVAAIEEQGYEVAGK